MNGRVVLAVALALAALGVGILAAPAGHVTGGTILALALAMTALHVIAPLIDDGSDDVGRITLDEACARADAQRRDAGRVKVTRGARTAIAHRPQR